MIAKGLRANNAALILNPGPAGETGIPKVNTMLSSKVDWTDPVGPRSRPDLVPVASHGSTSVRAHRSSSGFGLRTRAR